MKLSPLHPILWSSLLILLSSQSETHNRDVCRDGRSINNLQVQSFSARGNVEIDIEENQDFSCFLNPANILNCSWSFQSLQRDAQLSVYISVCDDKRTVNHLSLLSEEGVGSKSLALRETEKLYVILHFNVSLCNTWAVYAYEYDMEMLEVLSPPRNISASVKDGDLLVTWGVPRGRADYNPSCFEYQLDFGEQETPTETQQMSYTMPHADHTSTYRVRIRARKSSVCLGSTQWSAWSHTVTVEHSFNKIKILVIISISLGIPMILLAFLLLLRHPSVCRFLFPPVPHPPSKLKYFLEDNDSFNFYGPAAPVKSEEEITEVEEGQQPVKTF